MKPKREEILKKGLNSVQNDFDYILLDCPPTLGVLAETGIAAADFVIVPCQMESRAADGLVDLLDLIYTLKGENFENYRILITKLDSRKTVTNEVIMEQLSQWKRKFFKTKIPLNESLNQMQMARTDIFSYDANGKGAKAYWELTKEILENGSE
jgi:chromosome partitioning protein